MNLGHRVYGLNWVEWVKGGRWAHLVNWGHCGLGKLGELGEYGRLGTFGNPRTFSDYVNWEFSEMLLRWIGCMG